MDYIFNGRTNIFVEPSTPDGSLILVFHGAGGSPNDIQSVLNLEAKFPNSHILYVASLDGIWRSNLQDVDRLYVDNLVAHIKANFNISSVHLLGHSNGGMLCYKIGAVLDELGFNSITVIASVYQNPHEFDFKKSVLHILCDEDTVIPKEGNSTYPSIEVTKAAVKSNGRNNTFIEFQGIGHSLSDIVTVKPEIYDYIKINMGL